MLAQKYGNGRHLWDVPAPTFMKLLKVMPTLVGSRWRPAYLSGELASVRCGDAVLGTCGSHQIGVDTIL